MHSCFLSNCVKRFSDFGTAICCFEAQKHRSDRPNIEAYYLQPPGVITVGPWGSVDFDFVFKSGTNHIFEFPNQIYCCKGKHMICWQAKTYHVLVLAPRGCVLDQQNPQ